MIENFFKNELSLRRWMRFKSSKRAVASCWILLFLMFLSVTAEMWANSKPIILKFQGHIYFPIFNYYHPTEFGRTDILQMDYRALRLAEDDWWLQSTPR